MAISVRNTTVGTQASGGSPVTVNKPTGTTSGDLLIAVQYEDQFGSTAAMTGATGFTQQGTTYTAGTTGNGSVHGKVWKRAVDGSEGSSFTFGQNDTSVVILLCITGQDATTPINIDVTWSTGLSGQTSHVAPAVTPTVDDALLLCGFSTTENTNLGTSYTPAAGMTEAGDGDTTFSFASVDYLVLSGGSGASTGTKAATSSRSTVNEYVTLSMVVAPAAGGATTPNPRQPIVKSSTTRPSQAAAGQIVQVNAVRFSNAAAQVTAELGTSTLGVAAAGAATKVQPELGRSALGLAATGTQSSVRALVGGVCGLGTIGRSAQTKTAVGAGAAALGLAARGTEAKTVTANVRLALSLTNTGRAARVVTGGGRTPLGLSADGLTVFVFDLNFTPRAGVVADLADRTYGGVCVDLTEHFTAATAADDAIRYRAGAPT